MVREITQENILAFIRENASEEDGVPCVLEHIFKVFGVGGKLPFGKHHQIRKQIIQICEQLSKQGIIKYVKIKHDWEWWDPMITIKRRPIITLKGFVPRDFDPKKHRCHRGDEWIHTDPYTLKARAGLA